MNINSILITIIISSLPAFQDRHSTPLSASANDDLEEEEEHEVRVISYKISILSLLLYSTLELLMCCSCTFVL